MTEHTDAVVERLPESLPGHWTTPAGLEMARRYAAMTRGDLDGGDLTDMEAAHHVAMTMRGGLDHEARLAVGRDRISWLSAQLALALARGEDADARVARAEASKYRPGVLRCARCNFRLVSSTFNARDGTVTPRETTEPCPNDGAPMWRVSWEEECRAADGLTDQLFDRATAAEASAAQAGAAWTWLAGQHHLSLDFDYPDEGEEGEWQVHRVSGNVNDREWEIIGAGVTALEAVEAARAALRPTQSPHQVEEE